MRVNSTDLQNSFGKYLSLVEKEDIIVVKNGKTVAKLVKYIEPQNFFVHKEAESYRTRKITYEEYMDLVDLEKKEITLYSFTEERELDNVLSYKKGDIIESAYFEGLKISLDDIFDEIIT